MKHENLLAIFQVLVIVFRSGTATTPVTWDTSRITPLGDRLAAATALRNVEDTPKYSERPVTHSPPCLNIRNDGAGNEMQRRMYETKQVANEALLSGNFAGPRLASTASVTVPEGR